MPIVPGQKDPLTGRLVQTLVAQVEDVYYVFIDEHNEIYYNVLDDNFVYAPEFNALHSRIRRLEVLSLHNLSKREQGHYNYLLGNCLSEALEEIDLTRHFASLANIEVDINEVVRNNQMKYFSYGTITGLALCCLAIISLHLFKTVLRSHISAPTYELIFCSMFGGIGAMVFNYRRTQNFRALRVIGNGYQYVDGLLRVIYGVFYAIIALLGIKSGAILSFVQNNSIYLYCFIAVVAGASDKFIMGILKTFEKKTEDENQSESKKREKSKKDGSDESVGA